VTSSDDHAKIKALFLDALELDLADREALLNEAPPAIAEAARALLERDEEGATPFEASIGRAADVLQSAPSDTPERVGSFRIVERIGAGGMGVVYEAVEDDTERHVALKLLAPGLVAWSGPKVKERFRREIIALSRLEHPGIARILSHGELGESARPWFAMELVRGRDLGTYVKEEQPALAARVRLFHAIAEAVAHAHQRGIAHRDLKPENILITSDGEPKVLDFGIARMFEDNGATRLTLERTAAFVGTLAYLPPERLDTGAPTNLGLDGRRGDVYALGCVFWEALFGRLPLPLEGTPLPAALEILRTEEIPSPRKLSYKTESGTRSGHLPRDLAVILETCLAREPVRRYADAGALALDLERFAASRPIHARPPSAGYRSLKFIRRHRVLVAATLLVFASLTAGIVTTARQAKLASQAERRATAVRDFLLDDMLRGANPWRSGQVRVEDLLRQAGANMDKAFAGDSQTLELMRLVLGETWAGLGRSAEARPYLEQALKVARKDASPDLEAILVVLATLDLDGERPKLAAPVVHELEALSPDSQQTLWLAGRLASEQGAFEMADAKFDEVGAKTGALHAALLNSIAQNKLRQGHYPAALEAISTCLLDTEERLGSMSPELAIRLATRSQIEIDTGELDAAQADLDRAVAILTEQLGGHHPALLPLRLQDAQIAFVAQEDERAFGLLQAIQDDLPSRAQAPLLWARLLSTRASLTLFQDKTDEALAMANEAMELVESAIGSAHPLFATMLLTRAPIFEWRGDLPAAIEDLERASTLFANHVSPLQAEYAETELTLGSFLMRAGRFEESLPHLQHAVQLFETIRGAENMTTLFAKHELALGLIEAGTPSAGRDLLRELIEVGKRLGGASLMGVAENLQTLGFAEARLENFGAAVDAYESAAQLFSDLGAPTSPNLAKLYASMSKAHLQLEHFSDARAAATQALELYSAIMGSDSPSAEHARDLLTAIDAAAKNAKL